MSDTSPEALGLTQILQVSVPVSDVDRAIAFYRDTLGMRFLFKAPPGLGFFDCGGIRVMLDAPARAQSRNYSSVLYYKVPDIKRARQELGNRGAVFLEEPHLIAKMPDHDLWLAILTDPDENLIGLMSEVRD